MKTFSKLILLIAVCLFSCNRGKNIQDISSKGQKEVYSINLADESDHFSLDLDTLVDITSITKLQITDNRNSVLVNYTKVLIKDSLLFVLDKEFKGLKVFTLNGDFVRMIGSIGQGPGEYTYLNDFRISNDTVSILSGTQQIINYKLNGEYLNTLEIERFAANFAANNSKFYFFMNYNVGSPDGSLAYNLEITNKNFELIARGAPFSEASGNIPSFAYTGFLQEKSNEIWFSEAFGNSIQIVKGTELTDKYVFDFGSHIKPEKTSVAEVAEKQLTVAHLGKNLFENEKFLIFDYFINPQLKIGIYDRITKRFYDREKFVKNYKSLLFSVPNVSLNQKEFISIIPVEFLIYIKRNPEFSDYIKQGNAELYKIVSEYQESDNPLIIRYRFKD